MNPDRILPSFGVCKNDFAAAARAGRIKHHPKKPGLRNAFCRSCFFKKNSFRQMIGFGLFCFFGFAEYPQTARFTVKQGKISKLFRNRPASGISQRCGNGFSRCFEIRISQRSGKIRHDQRGHQPHNGKNHQQFKQRKPAPTHRYFSN